jgi:hypothetical protein
VTIHHQDPSRPRYTGDEEATFDRVVMYLTDNFTLDGDMPVTRDRAATLVRQHGWTLGQGLAMGSFAYYVGDQVAEVETLIAIPESNPEAL